MGGETLQTSEGLCWYASGVLYRDSGQKNEKYNNYCEPILSEKDLAAKVFTGSNSVIPECLEMIDRPHHGLICSEGWGQMDPGLLSLWLLLVLL